MNQFLAPLSGPDPPFLPASSEGKAQTITLMRQIAISNVCKLENGTSMCGQPKFKLTDSDTLEEITTFRHEGLTWDAQKSQITLKPHSEDKLGLHKIILNAYISDSNEVHRSVAL